VLSQTITLILTAHDQDFYLSEMMKVGVAGYLTKSERGENLLAAIRRAVNGDRLFTKEQFERVHYWREAAGGKWDSLTERERQIACLLMQGLSDAALAKTLEIAPRTASSHVANLLKKLGVASRQEAVAWLLKHLPEMYDNL
jgi:DNA-binding NarL/FixJ family response regulator